MEFGFSESLAVADIDTQIKKVPDFTKLAAGLTGNQSDFAVNHLMMVDSKGHPFVVSEYVIR